VRLGDRVGGRDPGPRRGRTGGLHRPAGARGSGGDRPPPGARRDRAAHRRTGRHRPRRRARHPAAGRGGLARSRRHDRGRPRPRHRGAAPDRPPGVLRGGRPQPHRQPDRARAAPEPGGLRGRQPRRPRGPRGRGRPRLDLDPLDIGVLNDTPCRFPDLRNRRRRPSDPRRSLLVVAPVEHTPVIPTRAEPKMVRPFEVVSDFRPAGDQPAAIEALADGVHCGERFQTLLGITGSGKSATIAWTIEQVQRPTLVLAPNKSLAAQLANEFREFFPHNRVEYFVSYYDYYQPEAYMPTTDTFIEKDSSVNDEIERLRHAATSSLLTRRDTIVVASVS